MCTVFPRARTQMSHACSLRVESPHSLITPSSQPCIVVRRVLNHIRHEVGVRAGSIRPGHVLCVRPHRGSNIAIQVRGRQNPGQERREGQHVLDGAVHGVRHVLVADAAEVVDEGRVVGHVLDLVAEDGAVVGRDGVCVGKLGNEGDVVILTRVELCAAGGYTNRCRMAGE